MKRLIEKTVFWGCDGLPLRHLPDQPLAILRERDHGRRDAPAFGVGDDDGSPPSITATTSW